MFLTLLKIILHFYPKITIHHSDGNLIQSFLLTKHLYYTCSITLNLCFLNPFWYFFYNNSLFYIKILVKIEKISYNFVMFRCKECGKIYPNRTQYCECGSSEFIFTDNNKNRPQPKKEVTLDSNQMVSWAIFAVCVIAAIIILCL